MTASAHTEKARKESTETDSTPRIVWLIVLIVAFVALLVTLAVLLNPEVRLLLQLWLQQQRHPQTAHAPTNYPGSGVVDAISNALIAWLKKQVSKGDTP